MSAVETLREAAEKLRTLSWDATPGPWHSYTPQGSLRPHVRAGADDVAFMELDVNTPPEVPHGNAEYIAAVHPGVGLALGDWLSLVARLLDEGFDHNAETAAALDVARAVLWRGSERGQG